MWVQGREACEGGKAGKAAGGKPRMQVAGRAAATLKQPVCAACGTARPVLDGMAASAGQPSSPTPGMPSAPVNTQAVRVAGS